MRENHLSIWATVLIDYISDNWGEKTAEGNAAAGFS